MNIARVFLSAVGGIVAYFAFGGILFVALPQLQKEFAKYPAVYRTHESQESQESMKTVMPVGMLGIFLAILVLAVLFAMLHREPATAREGAILGALIGIFVVGGFVLHNYMLLNIGLKVTLQQAGAYFLQWTVVGIVIGLIYKPLIAN
jgi:hypothetical protein